MLSSSKECYIFLRAKCLFCNEIINLLLASVVVFYACLGIAPSSASAEIERKLGMIENHKSKNKFQESLNKSSRVKSGEVLVDFEDNQPVKETVNRLGGVVQGKELGEKKFKKVKIKEGISVDSAVKRYNSDPNVKRAQPNYRYRSFSVKPNDPHFSKQWGLKNSGQEVKSGTYDSNHNLNTNPGVPDKDVGAIEAWDDRTGCEAIPVAILDSGINHEHEDLQQNMWKGGENHGYDFVEGDGNPLAKAGSHHGSHVAGIIGAVGNNSLGGTGVCWQAELMAVRVLNNKGIGTTSSIVEGINYALDNGAKILNLSLGLEFPRGEEKDPALQKAIQKAKDKGALVVVSAGNSGEDVDGGDTTIYPCSDPSDNVICVAGLDQQFGLAEWSNYGSTSVDLGAPGTNIVSIFSGSVDPLEVTDWEKDTQWGKPNCPELDIDVPLSNPSSWCETGSHYQNSIDSRTYKTLDLSSKDILDVGVSFWLRVQLQEEDQLVSGYSLKKGVDPFGRESFSKFFKETNYAKKRFQFYGPYLLEGCIDGHCTLGFRLKTNQSIVEQGVAIHSVNLHKISKTSKATGLMHGTSMATAYVTGIAALTWSERPDVDYTAVKGALFSGGEPVHALDSKTVTGKAVQADSALKEMPKPKASSSNSGGNCLGGCTLLSSGLRKPVDPIFLILLAISLVFLLGKRQ